ncbi:protein Gawky-like [Adelges cooleyi]|uniref:protein Gawky-like n=1 Tax=Adelges cooleyi TaxID=133065 RepID=UPI00217F3457|nr:protein Gawky-like [Adelges cooleyi]
MSSSGSLNGRMILIVSVLLISLAGIEAGQAPSDGLPWEFDRKTGTVMVADNVLTGSVNADGGKMLKVNEAQPIKRYNFNTESIGGVGSNKVVQHSTTSTSSGGSNTGVGNAGATDCTKVNNGNCANSGTGSLKANNDLNEEIFNYVMYGPNGVAQNKKKKVTGKPTKTVAPKPTYSVYTINGGNGNAWPQYDRRINNWMFGL